MAVLPVEAIESSESLEVVADLSLFQSWRLRLRVTVRGGDPHADILSGCDLFTRQLAGPDFGSRVCYPEADSPAQPDLVGFRVRVAVIPVVGRQANDATFEVDSASPHVGDSTQSVAQYERVACRSRRPRRL